MSGTKTRLASQLAVLPPNLSVTFKKTGKAFKESRWFHTQSMILLVWGGLQTNGMNVSWVTIVYSAN